MMIRNVKNPVADALQQYTGGQGTRNDTDRPVIGVTVSAVTERIDLSLRAKEIRQIRAALTDVPDRREDKIATLKRDIVNSKYRIQPEVVAKKMIDESLIDIFA
jgi:flagellar biosynthesis anti-sigma factor FlgM